MSLARFCRSLEALRNDVVRMWVRAADQLSFVCYLVDRLRIAFHIFDSGPTKLVRVVRLKNGLRVSYRRDPGDLQSIREVLLQEVYRLPSGEQRKTIVDLGANIGLASTWLAKRYNAAKVIALEPDESNCLLTRENFIKNAVPGVVIEAAIGAKDGVASFQAGSASNRGRVGQPGREVTLLSMNSVFSNYGIDGNINLLKIDIEGSELDLFTGDISWLHRIEEIIIEFHPTLVPYERLVRILIESGFSYTAPEAGGLAMDYFKRRRS
jgi:FkbM family methyltransferase